MFLQYHLQSNRIIFSLRPDPEILKIYRVCALNSKKLSHDKWHKLKPILFKRIPVFKRMLLQKFEIYLICNDKRMVSMSKVTQFSIHKIHHSKNTNVMFYFQINIILNKFQHKNKLFFPKKMFCSNSFIQLKKSLEIKIHVNRNQLF